MHSPSGGQGMDTGIQDGYALGRAFATQSVDGYEAQRRPVAERVVAVIMGRKTFDTVDGAWSTQRGYGADRDGRPPFFVVTGRAPGPYRLAASHDFTFVLDGPAAAVGLARAAAGDRDVFVMGGGTLIGSCLRAGLLDELRLHVSPEVLGAGTPLFAGSAGTGSPKHPLRYPRSAPT